MSSGPDLILGGGIAGVLVAQRLRQLNRPFLLLEARDRVLVEASSGFFFLHQPIFGEEEQRAVEIRSCASAAMGQESLSRGYARKVYGDPDYGPVSICLAGHQTGYLLSSKRLQEGLDDTNRILSAVVASISIGAKTVYLKDGRAFPFERLHSTIPLPAFEKAVGVSSGVVFKSAPIHIDRKPITNASDPMDRHLEADVYCHYCPGECHPWYRATRQQGRIDYEYVTNPPYGSFAIKPGKIWLPPEHKDYERGMLDEYRKILKTFGIHLWGRFGTWTPKMLSHHVWNELQTL